MNGNFEDTNDRAANSEYDWDAFNPDAYFEHHYAKMRSWDDEPMAAATAAFFAKSSPLERSIDVGTGTNLYPILAVLPRVQSVTAFEYGSKNVAWLRAELARPRVRKVWLQFWAALKEQYPEADDLPDSPAGLLKKRLSVEQGSVFDLPERQFDAGTMFFCAESITKKKSEFTAACSSFFRSVKAGGPVVAAFMEGSFGYPVGNEPFPAYFIRGEKHLRSALEGLVRIERITHFPADPTLRGGYKGMLLLEGFSQ